MFETLITSGQLKAPTEHGRWEHFSTAGLDANSIHAQRAAFAMRAVRGMEIGKLTAAVAGRQCDLGEVRPWLIRPTFSPQS
jgi:hypothetical protein